MIKVLSVLYLAEKNDLETEVYGMGDQANLILNIAEGTTNQLPMSKGKQLLKEIRASQKKGRIMFDILQDKPKENLRNSADYEKTVSLQ